MSNSDSVQLDAAFVRALASTMQTHGYVETAEPTRFGAVVKSGSSAFSRDGNGQWRTKYNSFTYTWDEITYNDRATVLFEGVAE